MNYIIIFIIFFFITSCNTISPGINKDPSKSGFAPAKRLSKNLYSQSPIEVQNLSYKNINVELHNINKMKRGIKLKDKDRLPWLIRINKRLKRYNNLDDKYIIACSALKKNYRNILSKDLDCVFFLYLKCKEIELIRRNYFRQHFFPLSLVENQISHFETSSDLININADKNVRDVATIVIRKIKKIM